MDKFESGIGKGSLNESQTCLGHNDDDDYGDDGRLAHEHKCGQSEGRNLRG